ncbi:ATP-dependent exoDNAse (exonuclease V) beta subunit (contains helicase and exonuclease domains) [Algoriphagus faecimaris]|uniref:DNA 3'-5' helicase n=1 Tax=Algoriphagus faecimaris TaxID=686796 RepID=A0A1G6W2A6_9BACT|nr:UvrD-helicase domain-containing protein [Algoriphagus faecimaris]SDD60080.1 ATP-dependent exoDNAse (exonuclease V) beta subunit (contains helicase and exonuclease domains) [Algoriphagus faecimaris]
MENKPFIIYKSSAGSGKTYTLTLEYLKLALRQPTAFRQILAVTFTNKATQEMKERILSVLRRISQQVDEEEFLDQELKEFLQVDAEGLRQKAKATLTAILHDYSHFSVSTIDSFFQKVVRAFAREIDLNAKFEVELDQDGVLQRVVDRVVMQVMDDEFLHKWLVDYAIDQIQNGKSWDIRKNIHGLGKQIFQENFKQHAAEIKAFLSEKENADQLQKLVRKRRDELIKLGKAIKEQANQIRIAHGLEWKDYNRGFLAKFDKFGDRNSPFSDFTDLQKEKASSPEGWATKTSKNKEAIESSYYAGLGELLGRVPQLEQQWNTISAISRNIYVYGVFRNLIDDLSLIKEEENMLLISDANEFLKEITHENDAPFIYEKVGNQFQHFLIDEFQDTSGFQWASFKPLLQNSLSFGHPNLLVGDVKQSIYRWRGGEMKLLLEQVEQEIGAHLIDAKNLATNYRSLPRIIEFNNALFHALPASFERVLSSAYGVADPSILSKAYGDVEQKVSSKKANSAFQGMVRMEFLMEDKELEDEGKFNAQVIQKIPEQVRKLQDLGYQLKDIAFLVRTKSEGEEIADCLMLESAEAQDNHYRYDVLSDESMFLDKAASVKALVSALSYLYQPEDEVQFKTMWYYRAVLLDQKVDHDLFSLNQMDEAFAMDIASFKEQEQGLLQLSLLEMTEELIRILGIQETGLEKAYISGFREAIFDFISKNRSDLGAFLEWWEVNKQKRTVKIPEGHDAMRILTIHKSKGLQFKVVLMPFLKWTIFDAKQDNIVWSPFEDTESGLRAVIPLNLQGSLSQSFFADTYGEEATLAYLDSLNMIYVALTRAEEIFWSLSPYKGSFNSENYLELHLQQLLETGISEIGAMDSESNVFQLGDWPESTVPEKAHFQAPSLRWTYTKWEELLEVKQYAVDFSAEGMEQRKKRNFGLLVHEILEKSDTLKQAELELDTLYFEGRLSSEEKEEVLSQLKGLFENALFASWFDPEQLSLNEQGILLPGGKQKRPDRILLHQEEVVVVDFKTGEEQDRYAKQVKEYMELVHSLTQKPCKGYLCYLETGKIKEVHA